MTGHQIQCDESCPSRTSSCEETCPEYQFQERFSRWLAVQYSDLPLGAHQNIVLNASAIFDDINASNCGDESSHVPDKTDVHWITGAELREIYADKLSLDKYDEIRKRQIAQNPPGCPYWDIEKNLYTDEPDNHCTMKFSEIRAKAVAEARKDEREKIILGLVRLQQQLLKQYISAGPAMQEMGKIRSETYDDITNSLRSEVKKE